MKKFILLTMCLLGQMASLQAFDVEARVAYFYPANDRMRDVYGKEGWAEYEIEASTPLTFNCDCTNWDAFFNASYFYKRGHSTCLHDRTTVNNWAFNFGVKRYFDTCWCFRPYLGLGVGFAHVRFHDESPFVTNKINRWGVAVLAKSGIRYDISCNFFADLFLDYAYTGYRFCSGGCRSGNDVDTGGVKVGLGLGYQF